MNRLDKSITDIEENRVFRKLRELPLIDRYAVMDGKDQPSDTLTELVQSRERMATMALVGCGEKYKKGEVSDFEWLEKWEACLPLCPGLGLASIYEEEMALLGLDPHGTAKEKWTKFNEIKQSKNITVHTDYILKSKKTKDIWIGELVMDNINKGWEYQRFLRHLPEQLAEESEREIHLLSDLSEISFERPNPHLALQSYHKLKDGEKLNSKEAFVLQAQVLIECLLALRKLKKRAVIHLYGGDSAGLPCDLLRYLRAHSLADAEIRVGLTLSAFPRAVGILTESFPDRVELVLRPSALSDTFDLKMEKLISSMPFGGLRFGGVLTDAPLLEATHILVKKRIIGLLSQICDNEEQVLINAEAFFDIKDPLS